ADFTGSVSAAGDSGVSVFDPGAARWIRFPSVPVANRKVTVLSSGGDGSILIGTAGGIGRYDGSNWGTFWPPTAAATDVPGDLRQVHRGELGLATAPTPDTRIVYRRGTNLQWQEIRENLGAKIAETEDGDVWIGQLEVYFFRIDPADSATFVDAHFG